MVRGFQGAPPGPGQRSANVQVRDVALSQRDDVDAGDGEALEEACCVFLVPAKTVQSLREYDVKSPVQRVTHQSLESGAKQCGAGDRVVGELQNDRPVLASCELAAHPKLVRDRGIALVVR
jgi:hypothetical protein